MKIREQALRAVNYAIQKRQLVRPEICELCGINPDELHPLHATRIVAHHWRGYSFPLDIWFVCKSCNAILKYRHDGLLTKTQAVEYVSQFSRWYEKPDYTKGYLSALEYHEAKKNGSQLPKSWDWKYSTPHQKEPTIITPLQRICNVRRALYRARANKPYSSIRTWTISVCQRQLAELWIRYRRGELESITSELPF